MQREPGMTYFSFPKDNLIPDPTSNSTFGRADHPWSADGTTRALILKLTIGRPGLLRLGYEGHGRPSLPKPKTTQPSVRTALRAVLGHVGHVSVPKLINFLIFNFILNLIFILISALYPISHILCSNSPPLPHLHSNPKSLSSF